MSYRSNFKVRDLSKDVWREAPARFYRAILLSGLVLSLCCVGFAQTAAPTTYSAYTGTDAKPAPPAPALGPANSVINDPTFGSRILRVTDANTLGGQSFVPSDSGFHRT